MNYSLLIKGLIGDIKKGIQYKNLGGFGILAGILLLPYIVSTAFCICGLYVMLFFFNGISASIDYLEGWIKNTKEGVHPATEAVLYFVCMPAIFAMRMLVSFFAIVFYFEWFVTMCISYVATLGGIKWQPFIGSADFENIPEWEITTNPVIAKSATIAFYCVFLFSFLLALVGVIVGAEILLAAGGVFVALANTALPISVIIIYRKKAATPARAPAEEPVEA